MYSFVSNVNLLMIFVYILFTNQIKDVKQAKFKVLSLKANILLYGRKTINLSNSLTW